MRKWMAIGMALWIVITTVVPVHATQAGTDAQEQTTEQTAVYTTEYPEEPAREPDLVSEAAVVMDVRTGTVIYEKNAYIPEYPASITKIITCLLGIENLNMADSITFSNHAVYSIERDSSNVGIKEGETIKVENCFQAMMIESANEAACAIAEQVAGSEEAFAEMMNERAAALGCRNSHFVNPHGLHNAEHYTCAYDMALFLREALNYPSFRTFSSMISGEIPATSMTDEVRPLWNTLKMIRPGSKYYYENIEGGKTGYTTDANCTLATYAKKGDMELVCVVMNCAGRTATYSDTKALYEYCFRNFSYYYPLAEYTISDTGTNDNVILQNYYKLAADDLLQVSINREYCLVLNHAVNREEIVINTTYTKGADAFGQLEFSYQGQVLGSTPLTYATAQGGTVHQTTKPPETSQAAQDKPQTVQKKVKIPLFVKVLLVIVGLFGVYWVYLNYKRYQRRIYKGRRRRNRNRNLRYARRR